MKLSNLTDVFTTVEIVLDRTCCGDGFSVARNPTSPVNLFRSNFYTALEANDLYITTRDYNKCPQKNQKILNTKKT